MLYCRGADRHDVALMKSTYWPDSQDDHGGFVGNGQDWADAAYGWQDKIDSCSHHVTNVLSEIDGHRAKRESMFICVVPFKDPKVTMFQAGRYRDLCEKRDGVWKILNRTCIWDWVDVRPINPDTDIVNVPRMSHWRAFFPHDPIYEDWAGSPPTERPW